MSDIALTKDADKMLCTLYKAFLNRRKEGISKRDAKYFANEYFSDESPFSKMDQRDVADTRMELGRNGYLKIYIGGDCLLTDPAIVYLENRFKNGLRDVLSFLAQFMP